MVTCSRDGTAKLWDVASQRCIHTYSDDSGLGVVNSCDIQAVDDVTLGDGPTAVGEICQYSPSNPFANHPRVSSPPSRVSRPPLPCITSPSCVALLCGVITDSGEVNTKGKVLLTGTEKGTVVGFSLNTKHKVSAAAAELITVCPITDSLVLRSDCTLFLEQGSPILSP